VTEENYAAATFSGDGEIPNNDECSAMHYRAVVEITGSDPAAHFEALFDANNWPSAWRNGIFSYHHFHTTAHEVLGIYSGRASVQLGGENGDVFEVQTGDVVVVPAGVGHKKIKCDGNLGVVAGYANGDSADMCTPDAERYGNRCVRVSGVAAPTHDPVYGNPGPLHRHWTLTPS